MIRFPITSVLLLPLILASGTRMVVQPEPVSLLDASHRIDPAAERAAEVLEVAFRADRSGIEEWIRSTYAPDLLGNATMFQHTLQLAQIQENARSIEVVTVTTRSSTEAVALYKSLLTGEWRQLTVQIEATPPHRITNLSPPQLVVPPAPHTVAPRTVSVEQARAELDAYARRLAEADMFSGGVLVARGDEVLFHSAYGFASREFDVPNTTSTRFIIGSINKMFTAVGILQMLEQGRLSLQDPVANHLPGVLPDDVAAAIRIEHLLTHTSGLGDFLFTPEMVARSRIQFRGIADYLPLLSQEKLFAPPGTRWLYSNTGFLVLGAILERVSGQPYDEYVQRHIFEPAGMTQTGAPELDLVPRGLASAYIREFHEGAYRFRGDRYMQPVRGTPAGGGFSTPVDLHRFFRALLTHRLLKAETTAMMITGKPAMGSPSYGFGAQVFSQDGTRFGHTGGGPGTAAVVEYDATNDLYVVVLGNMNSGSASIVRRARQLHGAGLPTQSW